MIKRYDFSRDHRAGCLCGMLQTDNGKFVHYADYALALSRIEAAEKFIGARLACCTKNHLCDADELQRDFETFTRWQSTIRAMEGK